MGVAKMSLTGGVSVWEAATRVTTELLTSLNGRTHVTFPTTMNRVVMP